MLSYNKLKLNKNHIKKLSCDFENFNRELATNNFEILLFIILLFYKPKHIKYLEYCVLISSHNLFYMNIPTILTINEQKNVNPSQRLLK